MEKKERIRRRRRGYGEQGEEMEKKTGEKMEMKEEGDFLFHFCGRMRVAFLFSTIQVDWFMVWTPLIQNSRM